MTGKLAEEKYTWELNPSDRAQLEKELVDYAGDDKAITSFEAREQANSDPKASVFFSSGLPRLDALTEGFRGGELVVISGPTGNGKTTLARTITMNIAKSDRNALWFSYEERKKQFIQKFPMLPFFTLPNTLLNRTTKWIDQRVLEHKIKHDIKAVFIDHLHYLVDMERMRQPSLEIGTVVRNLKNIAVYHNIVVFLIAHIGKLKDDQEPDIDSIRDSGMIACEADDVFMVWRLKDRQGQFTNRAIAKVCKARETGVMGEKVNLVMVDRLLREEANGY